MLAARDCPTFPIPFTPARRLPHRFEPPPNLATIGRIERAIWLESLNIQTHSSRERNLIQPVSPAETLSITVDIQFLLLLGYVIALVCLWSTGIVRFCWHAIFASLVLAVSPRFVRTTPQSPELLPLPLRFFDPFQWVLTLLVVNLAIACYVIFKTGGSHKSPFSHLYFILPILALLLGLPDTLVYSYAGLALVAFTATIATQKGLAYLDERPRVWQNREEAERYFRTERIRMRIAFWAISVFAFGVALWVHMRRSG